MIARKKGMEELFKYQKIIRQNQENNIDNDYLFKLYNKAVGEEKIRIRNIIVQNNLQLVIKFLIQRYNYTTEENPVYDMEDIIQESSLLLIEAIEQYDSFKGEFSTFLYKKLANTIYYINSIPNSPIHFSRGSVYRYRFVKTLVDLDYEDEFISTMTNLPLATIKRLRPLLSKTESYEELINNNQMNTFIKIKDTIIGNYLISRIDEQTNIENRNKGILKNFKNLSINDKLLLIRMFGFDGNDSPLKLSKLKEDFGYEGKKIYNKWKNIKTQVQKDEILKELFYEVDSDYDDYNFDKTYYLQK